MADWRSRAVKVESAVPEADWRKRAVAVEVAPAVGADQATLEDLYGSELARGTYGFADDSGRTKYLQSRGFKNISRNAAGELVAQDPSGRWVKDQSEEFLKHPISWVASGAGKSLPLVGSVAGGVAGAASGLAAGGVGAIPTGMAGSGAGAMAGEGLRQATGRWLGVRDQYEPTELAKEGMIGAVSEGVGRALGPVIDPYIKAGVNETARLGKNAIAKTSSLLSGVDRGAVERLINRPREVLAAGAKDFAPKVVQKAREEALARNQLEKELIQRARTAYKNRFGEEPLNTSQMVERLGNFITEKGPNARGYGALTKDEVSELVRLKSEGLSGKVTGTEMQQLTDDLGRKIKSFEQSRFPGTGDTPYQANLRKTRHEGKALMHEADPALAQADKRFHEYATQAKKVSKLENDLGAEGFINNLYGANKSEVQGAAEAVFPEALEKAKDISAHKHWERQGPSGSAMGRRAQVATSMLLGGAGGGMWSHNPLMPVLGAAGAAALNPSVNRAVLSRGSIMLSPVVEAARRNPAILRRLALYPTVDELEQTMAPWTLMQMKESR